MNLMLAFVIGFLYATGTFMLLRRSIVKLILGIGLLGNATNLLLFTVGNASRDGAPIIAADATEIAGPIANPLPQALILTAIVIGMAMTAYAVVLAKQAYEVTQSDDIDRVRVSDE